MPEVAVRSGARSPLGNRGAITVSIMLATIMQGVDNTIANVALPHIQGSLSAAQDQIAWVLTSYIVAAAITMPLTGWLAGRFGIKQVFLISVVGFTVASALCGSATSLSQLVDLSPAAGGLWRRARAVVAIGADADQPARAPRSGDRGVGHRRHARPDLWPDARRLADRELQLALDLLHQPAGRGYRRSRHHGFHPRNAARASRSLRFFRFCQLERCGRRLADAARPRRAQGLVRLDRDLGRGGDRHGCGLSLHRPYGDRRRAVVSEPRSAEEHRTSRPARS